MKCFPLLCYGIAALTIALAALLKLLIYPLIVQEIPFLLHLGAVMVAAWFAGLGSGLLATALAALAADHSFLPPGPQLAPLAVFVLKGSLVSSLVAALHSTRQRTETSALEAQEHQESLRRTEERFRMLVEGVKDYAIVMLDTEGRSPPGTKGPSA